jgi:hypothetical protein
MTLKQLMRLQRFKDYSGKWLVAVMLALLVVGMAVAVLTPHRAPY